MVTIEISETGVTRVFGEVATTGDKRRIETLLGKVATPIFAIDAELRPRVTKKQLSEYL